MKEGQRLWTRDELLLVINLYVKLEFGKMHQRNPKVIGLAKLIDRTPGSIAYKLVNFASLDPTLQARGIKGASNSSTLDKEIWKEFYNNWDAAILESEQVAARAHRTTIEELNEVEIPTVEGLDKERVVKTRLNQNIFRKIMLARYEHKCCITGIAQKELLVASHILPWSESQNNRLNPMNGLLLNTLHDKAFEVGLITVDANSLNVVVSPNILNSDVESMSYNFGRFHNKPINLPAKFEPSREFLKYHNENRFRA